MSNDTWTLGRLLDWTTKFLKEKQAETPRLDAEVLLGFTVGCPRIQLYTRFDEPAGDQVRATYRELVKQRVEGCPVAYLVGYKEFYNLRFAVSPAVLIPRPETELLVLEAIRLAKTLPQARIVEIGTGSGAVAVTLAKHLPQLQITSTDVSGAALALAQRNAKTHGVAERIRFLEGDLFAALPAGEKFDLIVSNPPYIATEQIAALTPTVVKYEPRLALDGGSHGVEVIEKIATQAPAWLAPNGYLLLEIGADQGLVVPEFLKQRGWQGVTMFPDHAGLPRVVRAQVAQ
jgi:release factor glutamine methyltransferase